MARDLLAEGHMGPVRELIGPLVAESDPQSDDGAKLRALLAMVGLLEHDNDDRPMSLLGEYRDVDRRVGLEDSTRGEVATWLAWAIVAGTGTRGRADVVAALTLLSEAENIHRSSHEVCGLAWTLAGQVRALSAAGEWSGASLVLREARRLSNRLGHRLLDLQLSRLQTSHNGSDCAEDFVDHLYAAGIGGSAELAPAFETVLRASETGLAVLLVGETGTGRFRLARAMHDRLRSDGGFVRLDTAEWAVHSTDILRNDRDGKGVSTLFVPEVERLTWSKQDTLLRFVVDEAPRTRLVASTSFDPWVLVSTGRLTKAMYEHLGSVIVRIPPLRERPHDVNFIVRQRLQWASHAGAATFSLTDYAWRTLRSYAWPGNVEELHAELDRLIACCNADPAMVISSKDLAVASVSDVRDDPLADWAGAQILHGGKDLDAVLAEAERALIKGTLHEMSGNVTATAEMLGLSRQGLYKKMKRLEIDVARLHDQPRESVLEAR